MTWNLKLLFTPLIFQEGKPVPEPQIIITRDYEFFVRIEDVCFQPPSRFFRAFTAYLASFCIFNLEFSQNQRRTLAFFHKYIMKRPSLSFSVKAMTLANKLKLCMLWTTELHTCKVPVITVVWLCFKQYPLTLLIWDSLYSWK